MIIGIPQEWEVSIDLLAAQGFAHTFRQTACNLLECGLDMAEQDHAQDEIRPEVLNPLNRLPLAYHAMADDEVLMGKVESLAGDYGMDRTSMLVYALYRAISTTGREFLKQRNEAGLLDIWLDGMPREHGFLPVEGWQEDPHLELLSNP